MKSHKYILVFNLLLFICSCSLKQDDISKAKLFPSEFGHSDNVYSMKEIGLMWATSDSSMELNLSAAKKYCKNYRAGGFNDWRLPTKKEIMLLFSSGKLGTIDDANKPIRMHRRIWLSHFRETRNTRYSTPCFPIKTGYILYIHENTTFNIRVLPVRSI